MSDLYKENYETDSQQTAIERPEDCDSVLQAANSLKEDGHSLGAKDHFDAIYGANNIANRPLSIVEKRFLLAVERGDLPEVKR